MIDPVGLLGEIVVKSDANHEGCRECNDHEQTKLTAPAHQEFVRVLDTTEPSAKLVALMRMYRQVSRNE